ncbi:ABI3 protein, partial [Alectura lathami]|nr:ABI3 protein [Alectura lathami]
LQASDKRKALEETMALSAQSLASVAYQVSSLASTYLQLLDLQAVQLHKLEADVSCVAQRVDMHKEKVSRREIGALTVPRSFLSHQKIASPPSPPSLEPYCRKPLNFSILDDIGHGVKDHSTQLSRTGTLARKGVKLATQSAGSLGRSARVPEPVQPPMVPEGKLSAASSASSLTSVRYRRGPGRPLPGDLPPPPPEDLALPPPDLSPPAPSDLEPPLPPPPALPDLEDFAHPPPPAAEEPPWVPKNYLDKVVTLYPYTQQKDNELSFQPGALIYVTRRYSDGWCEGVLGEEMGFFPGNYVEPL